MTPLLLSPLQATRFPVMLYLLTAFVRDRSVNTCTACILGLPTLTILHLSIFRNSDGCVWQKEWENSIKTEVLCTKTYPPAAFFN